MYIYSTVLHPNTNQWIQRIAEKLAVVFVWISNFHRSHVKCTEYLWWMQSWKQKHQCQRLSWSSLRDICKWMISIGVLRLPDNQTDISSWMETYDLGITFKTYEWKANGPWRTGQSLAHHIGAGNSSASLLKSISIDAVLLDVIIAESMVKYLAKLTMNFGQIEHCGSTFTKTAYKAWLIFSTWSFVSP